MPLRALLYANTPETASSLAPVLATVGIGAETCADVFSAIEKATKQAFSCLIVDWSDQPEASFLVKRSRESTVNRNAVVIAVVDNEPASGAVRELRLDFLIYRPIVEAEAEAVLRKALQQMQVHAAPQELEFQGPLEHFEPGETPEPEKDPNLVSVTTAPPKRRERIQPPPEVAVELAVESDSVPEQDVDLFPPERSQRPFPFRAVCAGILLLAAVFCMWRARDTIGYLAHTREALARVLQESVAALLLRAKSAVQPTEPTNLEPPQDDYFVRTGSGTGAQSILRVVTTEADLPEMPIRLPRAFDLPLPAPEFTPAPLPPMHVARAQVPESLRGAQPIPPPVVAIAPQVTPVSVGVPPILQQPNEPVRLSEEAARALLRHVVEPIYPPEAAAQKLHGSVVLQALIGRDGSVEDLKLVRGYFVLGRAAIAAVKQWRFQPYSVNGRAAQAQTTLTITFARPAG